MNIEVYGKPGELVIYDKIKRTIIFYLVISFLILLGMSLVKFCNEPYKYLLVSPSFYNYEYLTWTTSVWGSLLGVHGTIAALSITFMGMFVGEVSTSSEFGFKSLSKVLLLRKYRFLEFSIQSVCSLLCGVFLLLIGSGLIGYMISCFFSLSFIVRYGVMYYRLYHLTEKPEIINGVLFDAIKLTSESYNRLNVQRQDITSEFARVIDESYGFSNDLSTLYWDENTVKINIFPNDPEVVISGFNPEIFDELSLRMRELDLSHSSAILIHLYFLSPLSSSSIKITSSGDKELTEQDISDIERLLRKGLLYSQVPYIYNEFKQFEEALVVNIRNGLINGDEWSLDFGVKIFFELTSNDNYIHTLKNIDLSITSANNKDVIQVSLLAKFLEKMVIEAINQNDLEKTANIMRSLIDLGRYVYSKNKFFEFYKKIFRQFDHRVRYRAEESNYVFLDLYTSNVISNLVYGNYSAFRLDTDFITDQLQYLDLSNRADHDSLNEMQRRMLRCVFEVVTLLIMRVKHVRRKGSEYNEELKDLIVLLKSWVNSKFLEEIYYKTELYDLLFTIPQEFSVFDAESKIREIPEGKASWRSIKNDTYKMISLMLTQGSFNNNRLNLLFVRNGAEFKNNTSITTHELNSIVSYLRGEHFDDFIKIITGDQSHETNKEEVASKLESVVSLINSLILRDVIDAELDRELAEKYIKEIEQEVDKYFELILPVDAIPVLKDVYGETSYLLVNKREVIPPIDGVSYGMNTGNHSLKLIYDWIRDALDSIDEHAIQIVLINSLQDLTTDKLITVEYKVDDKTNVYRYTKGLKINDKEGHLKLAGPGMYYLDLFDNFELKKSINNLTLDMARVEEGNIDEISGRYDFEDDNPYLYSILKATFNLVVVPKKTCKFYYLTEAQCRLMNEKQDREMKQLLSVNHPDNTGDNSLS